MTTPDREAGPILLRRLHDEAAGAGPDTADLITCLRLTSMETNTRVGTIASVRLLRDALAGAIEVPVAALAAAVEDVDPALAASIGAVWPSQDGIRERDGTI